MRPSGRAPEQMREISITRNYTKHAEGSVLIECGETKVICNATVERRVPGFLRGKGQGWVTAEYGMLPRSTGNRMGREASRGKQGGRTMEIQRLIGRSLRAAINLEALGENSITIDCDVIQADGGTRTASITGGYIALADAINHMLKEKIISKNPLTRHVAAISVGVYKGKAVSDLDYIEDSDCDTDMNIIMDDSGGFIEIQGTAEGDDPFTNTQLTEMLGLASNSITELIAKQSEVLEK